MLNKTNNTKNSMANKYSNIIKGLENIFEKIKKELITKKELSQDNFKVWEEKNQHLVHGFAWIATYIEALRQINKWGIELTNKNKLYEFEKLILDISFIEYVSQILNGIPMSQTEFIKLTDFQSVNKNDELKIIENFNFSNANELKERLVKIAVNKDNILTLENTALDNEFEQIREQFQKFNYLNVYNNANKWHLEDKLIPQKIIDNLAKLGVFGLTIPEKYGGLGLNKLAMCVGCPKFLKVKLYQPRVLLNQIADLT